MRCKLKCVKGSVDVEGLLTHRNNKGLEQDSAGTVSRNSILFLENPKPYY